MPGPVGARGPAPSAAEEHDHRAGILRLPEVDVRRRRWPGQLGPRQSPRDAGAVSAQRAGKLALTVDQLGRHLAEAGEPRAVGSHVVAIVTRGRCNRRRQHHQRDSGQNRLPPQIHSHVCFLRQL